MFGKKFQLNEQTLSIIEEIGRHMPGGFFIYQSGEGEKLLYANSAVLEIYGCRDLDQFRALTGFTFRGMVHPEDYSAVSESIVQQVRSSDDQLDYMEYRIIRRDGAVRWVEDFGHYTETEAYGGIYYVFLSDITQKREQRETDLAVRQAVIEALIESYHTVWLINDVETESFSLYRGDTQGKTIHGVPIRDALQRMKYSQAKDYYIRTTVAPVDQERLQKDLTMESIVAHLRERSQFVVTYLRMMDNGTQRYFRIEFAKVDMPGGKFGVVCGFKDVDDEVRSEMAVQKALEEQVALQEKLLAQEHHRKRQEKMISALAADYWSVYYLELDRNYGICYQSHSDVANGFKVGEEFSYLEAVTAYANANVTEEYRKEFLEFIQPDQIREGLKKERVISFRYMVHRNGKDSYEMVRFAGVRLPGESSDDVVHNVGACFTDVDVLTRRNLVQEQALKDALESAKQANSAKTIFLSNMSHEIRTPMNAIIGLNNIAMADPETAPKTKEYLEKIDTSAHHLLSIINDILDMSRIESGRMVIKNEEFSFSKVLEQVNTIISGQCRDKGLHYECQLRGKIDDYYIGDDMKLRQVMINILGNAVKFTPEGGSITFVIEETARFDNKATLRFVITDTGVGMSKSYLPHLFDAFSQENSSITNHYGSTGLGMPITKSIVELMNGHIEVESEKGKGSTFTVTITLSEADRDMLRGQDHELDLHPHNLSVLVIDDDPVACEHARIVLGQVGIRCDLTESGKQGVEMVKMRHARRDPYNLILIDWKMPEMDGLETTRRIRSVIGHESAIIILTSYNWEDIADEAKRAGVDTFVPKPLFAGSVMDEFREAFRRKNELLMASKVDLKGCHILLAEDMPVNAEIMMMLLSMREMDVDLAQNGREAVEKFAASQSGSYDAILMDMRMPEMDGLEATRIIRSMDHPDAKNIPIIALTANAFDEDVQRSMQAGLNAHLSKPVEPDALFDTLESLIR